MKNRNNIIDSWRAVAVLLVTAFHVFVWSGSTGFELPFGLDVFGALGNGWVGVGMFFVLSGYCMASSSQKAFSEGIDSSKYGIYFLNRFLRISGPYYVSMIFWYVVINVFNVAYKPTGIIDIVTHLFYVHNFSKDTMFSLSGVYWSLAVEMQFYLILPVFIFFIKKVSQKIMLLSISLVVSLLLNATIDNTLVTWSLVCYLCLFIAGWLCSTHQKSLGKILGSSSIFMMLSAIFVLILMYKGLRFDNMTKTYEIIVSCVFSLLLVSSIEMFGERNNFLINSLSFIGRASFSIYLYNYVFWFFERKEVELYQKILIFAFVICFGVVMHFLIEKNTEKLRHLIMQAIKKNKNKALTSEVI
ncbi:TPA: acyltransferase [Enterobacter roggenkampii]|nr:acyltransferase [Enterobacter roggenkampii]